MIGWKWSEKKEKRKEKEKAPAQERDDWMEKLGEFCLIMWFNEEKKGEKLGKKKKKLKAKRNFFSISFFMFSLPILTLAPVHNSILSTWSEKVFAFAFAFAGFIFSPVADGFIFLFRQDERKKEKKKENELEGFQITA